MKFIFPQLLRFTVTGAGATLLHVVLAIFLIGRQILDPVAANGTAFGVATVFSYLCNTRWSFQADINRQSAFRYLIIIAMNFAATLMFSTWAERMHWHYGVGITLCAIVLPLLNYFAHRHFTYVKQI